MNTPRLIGGAIKAARPWLLVGGIGAVGAGLLGWAGVFGGDADAPDSVSVSARVLDSRTGEPLEGVTVQVTDGSGVDQSDMSTLTAADGTFSIEVGPVEELGLRIDGTDIDYQNGFVGGGVPARFGFRVVFGWGEASVWSPSDLGDIALDPAFVEGVIRDSVTGAPVGGALVEVTDVPVVTETPDAVPGLSATTDGDGSFRIGGIFGTEELGMSIDGAAVGYETGFLGGSASNPFGLPVADTFAEASTWSTGDLGDIALDPLGSPVTTTIPTSTTASSTATTVPSATTAPLTTTAPPATTRPSATTVPASTAPPVTTAPPATTVPATTLPPATTTPAQNLAPSVNSLSVSTSPIYGGQGCSPSTSTITVNVTDVTGIASVTVQWSMPTEVSGTKTGTVTLTGPAGGGTWTGTIGALPDPPTVGTAVSLVVTARDPQGLVAIRSFPQSLIAQYCLG